MSLLVFIVQIITNSPAFGLGLGEKQLRYCRLVKFEMDLQIYAIWLLLGL